MKKYFLSYAVQSHPPRFYNETTDQHPLKWEAEYNADELKIPITLLWWTELHDDDGMEA